MASLSEAVSNAIKDAGVQPSVNDVVETPDDTNDTQNNSQNKETPDEDKDSEGSTSNDKNNEQAREQAQALELFQALKDPNRAPAIIKFMAEQAGYDTRGKKDGEQPTNKEVKQDVRGLVDELKESLGDYDFLADKIAPAIENYLKGFIPEATKEIQAKVEQVELRDLELEASNALTAIARQHFDADDLPKEVATEMSSLMQKMGPAEGQTTKEYLENLFYIASGRTGIRGKDSVNKQQKLNNNRNNAAQRLATVTPAPEANATNGKNNTDKKMSLKEAVAAATESVKAQLEK